MNSASRHVRFDRRGALRRGCWVGLLLLACQQPAWTEEALDEMLATASQGGEFVAPSLAGMEQAAALFVRMLDGEMTEELCAAWQQLGFALSLHEAGHGQWLVVQDVRRQGGGFYLFRRHQREHDVWPVAIQAPHSFHDLRTRELALLLMQQGKFAAAAWNTVHRYSHGRDRDVSADMAHTDDSYFQAFNRAFARRFPHGAIVQLHGFSQQKRTSDAGQSADMVLSTGSRSVTPSLLQLHRCIQQQSIGIARLFPMDIDELGATTNRNASMLRAMGFTGFVHVEMSAPLRKKLVEVKFLRERFLSCVREVWG